MPQKTKQKPNMLTTFSVLERNKDTIIDKWMEDLGSHPIFQHNEHGMQLLRDESRQIICSLVDLTRQVHLPDINPRELEPVIKMLIHLNKSRSKIGYSPRETAMYLFSLKKVFMEYLNTQFNNANEVSGEITKFNNLLDIMGIFAFEEFSLHQQKEVRKRDEFISYLRYQINNNRSIVNIIGKSPQMQDVFKLVGTIIDTDISILIQGESGTGKELIAEVIHYNGPRKSHPFIAVNCGALPAELIESELFGHEKGAFTGAVAEKLGKFELASEGTLFLDEIGEMPLNAQVKLLRALQNMEITRVGGTKTLQVNTRIIAATNRNLSELVEEGNFRKDLYYRLNVFPIQIPPIRERKEDILPLAHHFLDLYSTKYGKSIKGISGLASDQLVEYNWPGNAREIENCIHRAVIITSRDVLQPEDLNIPDSRVVHRQLAVPDVYALPQIMIREVPAQIRPLSEVEKEAISHALHVTHGNIKKTAEQLGISRTTLYTKIKEYRIDLP